MEEDMMAMTGVEIRQMKEKRKAVERWVRGY